MLFNWFSDANAWLNTAPLWDSLAHRQHMSIDDEENLCSCHSDLPARQRPESRSTRAKVVQVTLPMTTIALISSTRLEINIAPNWPMMTVTFWRSLIQNSGLQYHPVRSSTLLLNLASRHSNGQYNVIGILISLRLNYRVSLYTFCIQLVSLFWTHFNKFITCVCLNTNASVLVCIVPGLWVCPTPVLGVPLSCILFDDIGAIEVFLLLCTVTTDVQKFSQDSVVLTCNCYIIIENFVGY